MSDSENTLDVLALLKQMRGDFDGRTIADIEFEDDAEGGFTIVLKSGSEVTEEDALYVRVFYDSDECTLEFCTFIDTEFPPASYGKLLVFAHGLNAFGARTIGKFFLRDPDKDDETPTLFIEASWAVMLPPIHPEDETLLEFYADLLSTQLAVLIEEAGKVFDSLPEMLAATTSH